MNVELFSVEESLKLRENFIKSFTDKSQALRLYPYPEGNRCKDYIWEHMTDYTLVSSTDALKMIANCDCIYMMQDLAKYPDDHRLDLPFPRERIAKVTGSELVTYLSDNFPPPMGCYVFDDTFKWHITVTNEFDEQMFRVDEHITYDCLCMTTLMGHYDVVQEFAIKDKLRKKFINAFIDTNLDYFITRICPILSDMIDDKKIVSGYLFDCLFNDKKNLTEFYATINYLRKLKKKVYVMWDFYTGITCFSDSSVSSQMFINHFPIDAILDITTDKLCDMLIHDHKIVESGGENFDGYYLPEDLYVFDDSFTWYISFTHMELTTLNEKRICYSNINSIPKL